MQVKKHDGTLEAFMPEKIVVSIVKSGVPYETAKEIAGAVSKRKDKIIESSAIRDYVLKELKTRGHSAAVDHWSSYDRTTKHHT
jgi:transcriptional regulator NrdR family protein